MHNNHFLFFIIVFLVEYFVYIMKRVSRFNFRFFTLTCLLSALSEYSDSHSRRNSTRTTSVNTYNMFIAVSLSTSRVHLNSDFHF